MDDGASLPQSQQSVPDCTILVIDDFAPMRRLLRGMLRHLGYDTIVEAEDGVAALQLLQQRPIHLVIADVNMPRMHGVALLKAMRTTAHLHDIPVLFITAEADKDRVVQAMQLGIHGYIVKPFTPDRLQKQLQKVFTP